jgi:hypothetical protein
VRYAKAAGLAATFAWTVLAALTAASVLILPETSLVLLTLVVGALFLGVAAIVYWRTRSVVTVCRAGTPASATLSLALSELVSALIMFLLGALLISAVVSRVFGERLPLFG